MGGSSRNGSSTRLDLQAMREAAAHLVGSHDFRNFCRADLPTVTNFRRTIKSLTVDRIGEGDGGGGRACGGGALLTSLPGAPPVPPLRLPLGLIPPGQDGLVITLTGAAFLWHQVRCIVSVLGMVGRGLEAPGVVKAMLDTGPKGKFPAKPQYVMAPERPLLFCGAGFCGGDLAWRRSRQDAGSTGTALAGVRELLREQVAGTLMLAAVVAQLEAEERDEDGDGETRPPAPKRRARHRPLASRPCDPPLEERLAAKGLTIVEGDPTRPAAAGVDGMEIVEPGRR
jgi:tRNA pseudouridine38/39 synthase